jgi:hypothetical protein
MTRPVAELATPALGDQSTVTLEGSPPLPEVIVDFENPIMPSVVEITGKVLNVGKGTAVFDPPTMKSDAPEEVDGTKVSTWSNIT